MKLVSDSSETARNELHKFFSLAANSSDLSEMKMPRCLVDSCWHKLQVDELDYIRFCADSAGIYFEHSRAGGNEEITWVSRYHQEFGALSPLWFTSSDGAQDSGAYEAYIRSGAMIASWDCGPVLPEARNSIQGEIDKLKTILDINKKVNDLNGVDVPGLEKLEKIDDVAILESIKEKIDRFNIEKIKNKYMQ